jgi:hypothetical protein
VLGFRVPRLRESAARSTQLTVKLSEPLLLGAVRNNDAILILHAQFAIDHDHEEFDHAVHLEKATHQSKGGLDGGIVQNLALIAGKTPVRMTAAFFFHPSYELALCEHFQDRILKTGHLGEQSIGVFEKWLAANLVTLGDRWRALRGDACTSSRHGRGSVWSEPGYELVSKRFWQGWSERKYCQQYGLKNGMDVKDWVVENEDDAAIYTQVPACMRSSSSRKHVIYATKRSFVYATTR